jgi:hypothetical protein
MERGECLEDRSTILFKNSHQTESRMCTSEGIQATPIDERRGAENMTFNVEAISNDCISYLSPTLDTLFDTSTLEMPQNIPAAINYLKHVSDIAGEDNIGVILNASYSVRAVTDTEGHAFRASYTRRLFSQLRHELVALVTK